jgi:glycosyltransferase involved in cell wall biosynthesis
MREQASILNEEYRQRGIQKKIPREVIEREEREYGLATTMVVECEYVRKTHVEGGVPSEKVVVTAPGVDIGVLTPIEGMRDKFRVLMVLPSIRKGIFYMLEAWKKAKLQGAELWLAGPMDDDALALVEATRPSFGIRTLGRFSGASDFIKLCGRCSIFAAPTLFDGGPRALLEAMACGLPFVASDRSIGPDLVAEDQKPGFIVPAGDIEALADRLVWCHDHQQELRTIGRVARAVVEKRCQWSNYLDRLLMRLPAALA